MQKQAFIGTIYSEFYTRSQTYRPLVNSWEVAIITCKILQVINKVRTCTYMTIPNSQSAWFNYIYIQFNKTKTIFLLLDT